MIDTCKISIGDRTLFAPGVNLYSGTHPLDPEVRNGTLGPEMGKEIVIEEDCWIGGNAIVLPGITIGRGSVVGAGSVVTKVSMSMSWLICGEVADLELFFSLGCATIYCCGWKSG